MGASFAELGSVLLHDGWRIRVYRGSAGAGAAAIPARLAEARALVEEHYYRRRYRRIADYLRREDALMDEPRTLSFVLENEAGILQGHQILYGDGPSPVPCEILQPDVDQRRGSRHVFEVKRAVLLAKGRYAQLLEAIAVHVLATYGRTDAIPDDHLVVGYSVEPAVMHYLARLGFTVQTVRGRESFLSFPTRDLVARYGRTAIWCPLGEESAGARVESAGLITDPIRA